MSEVNDVFTESFMGDISEKPAVEPSSEAMADLKSDSWLDEPAKKEASPEEIAEFQEQQKQQQMDTFSDEFKEQQYQALRDLGYDENEHDFDSLVEYAAQLHAEQQQQSEEERLNQEALSLIDTFQEKKGFRFNPDLGHMIEPEVFRMSVEQNIPLREAYLHHIDQKAAKEAEFDKQFLDGFENYGKYQYKQPKWR